jgi:hypothetical protein
MFERADENEARRGHLTSSCFSPPFNSMNEPLSTRRAHFTPRWKLLARAYLPSIICGLAISTLVSLRWV